MMFGTVQLYAAAAALAVVIGLSVYAGLLKHQRNTARAETTAARQELSNYQAAAAAVIQARLAAQQAAEKERDRKTKEVTSEYQKRIAGVNARLAAAVERLRQHDAAQDRSTDAGVPGAAPASGGAGGSSDAEALAREVAQCLIEQERLRSLQEWLLRTH